MVKIMEHLFSISAYEFDLNGYGGPAEMIRKAKELGADGIELLTGYFDPDPIFKGVTKGVHLPYATDWYSVWCGDVEPADEENIKFKSYGVNKNDIVKNLAAAVKHASLLSPNYGVLHASNTRMDEVMGFTHRDTDHEILNAVAEILNGVASSFPGKEMPFKILLENLWWPGLTMKDDSGFRILNELLEFDNWGICLDTGHLMAHLGNCRHEEESISKLLRIFRSYPKEMTDRIDLIHLHMSLSADYIEQCKKNPIVNETTSHDEFMRKAYEHVCRLDEHRPFTSPSVTEIVETIRPRYVTHEISAPAAYDVLTGFSSQRSLFSQKTK